MDTRPGKSVLKKLSSALTVVALLLVSYSITGEKTTAVAADGLPVPAQLVAARALAKSKAAGTVSSPGAGVKVSAASLAPTAAMPGLNSPAENGLPESPRKTPADAGFETFHATAYSLKGKTASGIEVRPGIIAADPRVLPLGTVVELKGGRYSGTYTVLDTGGLIKGKRIDVYVPTYREAKLFGRQRVQIKVIGRTKTREMDRKRVIAAR